jgi:hypothetical protein
MQGLENEGVAGGAAMEVVENKGAEMRGTVESQNGKNSPTRKTDVWATARFPSPGRAARLGGLMAYKQ